MSIPITVIIGVAKNNPVKSRKCLIFLLTFKRLKTQRQSSILDFFEMSLHVTE